MTHENKLDNRVRWVIVLGPTRTQVSSMPASRRNNWKMANEGVSQQNELSAGEKRERQKDLIQM